MRKTSSALESISDEILDLPLCQLVYSETKEKKTFVNALMGQLNQYFTSRCGIKKAVSLAVGAS